MDAGKQRQHPIRGTAQSLRKLKGLQVKLVMLGQKRLDHRLIFTPQNRAGTVEQHTARLYVAAQIIDDSRLYLWQPFQSRQLLVSDIRLLSDHAEAGTRHVGDHHIHGVLPLGGKLTRVLKPRLQNGNPQTRRAFL